MQWLTKMCLTADILIPIPPRWVLTRIPDNQPEVTIFCRAVKLRSEAETLKISASIDLSAVRMSSIIFFEIELIISWIVANSANKIP